MNTSLAHLYNAPVFSDVNRLDNILTKLSEIRRDAITDFATSKHNAQRGAGRFLKKSDSMAKFAIRNCSFCSAWEVALGLV